MKAVPYALLLPLVHLAITIPLITLEEARGWKFIPRMQAIEDYDRAHPVISSSPGRLGWGGDAYSEYRPPTSVKAIYTAELPAGALVGWYRHPPGVFEMPPLANEGWSRRFPFVRLKTRIALFDFLLIMAIGAQWFFVGWRLERLRAQGRRLNLILIPALVITSAGVLMAVLSQASGILELIAILSGLVAWLGWIALALVAVTKFFTIAFHRFGRTKVSS
jgi:hypothetical protein